MSVEETSASCEHYIRKCRLVSPCCDKLYACRLCHDDREDHKLVRFDVKLIECLQCGNKQEVSSNCKSCLITFGKYFCGTCRLFDDRDKGQFHCGGCGICRIGGRDNYFHCDKCDICLNKSIMASHKCVEKSSRNNCAICLEDIHTSTIAAHVPDCGHLIHSSCLKDFVKSGGYTCPTCNICLFDMSTTWQKLDAEIAETPMPEEYANFEVRILCRDCHKHSTVKFHILGFKCGDCGSYNTSREDDGDIPGNPAFLDGNFGENEPQLAVEDNDEREDLIDSAGHDESKVDDQHNADTADDFDTGHNDVADNVEDIGSIESDVSLD